MRYPSKWSSDITAEDQGITGFLIERREGDIAIVDISQVVEGASGGWRVAVESQARSSGDSVISYATVDSALTRSEGVGVNLSGLFRF
jgi:hypothetical protein